MARRFAGDCIAIYVSYQDNESYCCKLIARDVHTRKLAATYKTCVGAPACGFGEGIAYDSPEAYDAIARTALAFASDEGCNPESHDEFSAACVDEITRTDLWKRF